MFNVTLRSSSNLFPAASPILSWAAAIVAGTFVILNGTATAGQCSVVGAIGTAINGTVTASNATVGTNTGFTYELILSTSTASGGVTGTFCLELETNEAYNAAV